MIHLSLRNENKTSLIHQLLISRVFLVGWLS